MSAEDHLPVEKIEEILFSDGAMYQTVVAAGTMWMFAATHILITPLVSGKPLHMKYEELAEAVALKIAQDELQRKLLAKAEADKAKFAPKAPEPPPPPADPPPPEPKKSPARKKPAPHVRSTP